jgi:hypothetical protein
MSNESENANTSTAEAPATNGKSEEADFLVRTLSTRLTGDPPVQCRWSTERHERQIPICAYAGFVELATRIPAVRTAVS